LDDDRCVVRMKWWTAVPARTAVATKISSRCGFAVGDGGAAASSVPAESKAWRWRDAFSRVIL
jgi:hypothetical protein